MNDLQDIAEAITRAVQDLSPGVAIEIPVDEQRWVRAHRVNDGWVLTAIQRWAESAADVTARRRDALVRLPALCRWATGVVASVDAQDREMLSTLLDPQAPTQVVIPKLEGLFGWFDECAPESTPRPHFQTVDLA